MHHPTWGFNTEVLCRFHSWHRLGLSFPSRAKKAPPRAPFIPLLRRGCRSHIFGSSPTRRGPHKGFIHSSWISALSLLFCSPSLLSATTHTLVVDDTASITRPLRYSPLSFFSSNPSLLLFWTKPSQTTTHTPTHRPSPLCWCPVRLSHFNLIKVDFWYREWVGF